MIVVLTNFSGQSVCGNLIFVSWVIIFVTIGNNELDGKKCLNFIKWAYIMYFNCYIVTTIPIVTSADWLDRYIFCNIFF